VEVSSLVLAVVGLGLRSRKRLRESLQVQLQLLYLLLKLVVVSVCYGRPIQGVLIPQLADGAADSRLVQRIVSLLCLGRALFHHTWNHHAARWRLNGPIFLFSEGQKFVRLRLLELGPFSIVKLPPRSQIAKLHFFLHLAQVKLALAFGSKLAFSDDCLAKSALGAVLGTGSSPS